jgi:hypothetical protein
VKDYIERQMEISDKLFKTMFEDHKERVRDMVMWAEMNTGLMKKLEERDAEIARLRALLKITAPEVDQTPCTLGTP